MIDEQFIQKAVALKYDGNSAPTVTATGTQKTAEEIIAIAQQHGIPLYENPELVSLLATLELGEEIPESLYITIAQLIAFAYYIQGKTPAAEDDAHQEPGGENLRPYSPIDLLRLTRD